ncbi:hypothetical protein CHUAL_009956 [Chamberlinius hualienensis]
MKTVADLLRYYISCFKFYGINFSDAGENFLSKVSRWIFKFIWAVELLLVAAWFIFISYENKIVEIHEEISFKFLIYYWGWCMTGSIFTKWYVYARVMTTINKPKAPYGKHLKKMLNSPIAKIPCARVTWAITQLHMYAFKMIYLACILIAAICVSSDSQTAETNAAVVALLISHFVYSYQLYFNSLCCLFLATIMDHVHAFHDETSHSFTGNKKTLNQAIVQYKYYKVLSKDMNALLSPVLLQTCASSLLSVVLIVVALSSKEQWVLVWIYLVLSQLMNSLATFLCLVKVAAIKDKHLQFVRHFMARFSEENVLSIRAIKCRSSLLWWFINELITNDDHFNIGNYIPVDESIFLMLIQTMFDMTANMSRWRIQSLIK